MTRESSSQIIIMRPGIVFANTVELGLVTFTIDKASYEQELTEENLKKVTDLPQGYSLVAMFTDRRENSLYIVTESTKKNKVCVSVRDLQKKEYVEVSSFKVPVKSKITKALYQQGGQIYTLDDTGVASLISIGSETINEVAENCTEILVTSNGFYARQLDENDNGELKLQLYHKGQTDRSRQSGGSTVSAESRRKSVAGSRLSIAS